MNLIRIILGPRTDRPFVLGAYLFAGLLAFAIYSTAKADEFICESAAGCKAVKSTDNGIREVTFKKGAIIETGAGWVLLDPKGWRSLDLGPDETAGLLP